MYLRLSSNATRRARWFERLGNQRELAFAVTLGSLSASGGLVPLVDVVLARLYPRQVMKTLPNGERIVLSEKEAETSFAVEVSIIDSADAASQI